MIRIYFQNGYFCGNELIMTKDIHSPEIFLWRCLFQIFI